MFANKITRNWKKEERSKKGSRAGPEDGGVYLGGGRVVEI